MKNTLFVLVLGVFSQASAAEFFCSSGNVTCLIASINNANGTSGKHTINLAPGSYTLQARAEGFNGLPVVTSSIRIQASADDPPTVIEGDPNPHLFRIFQVLAGGDLTLDGLTIQRGFASGGPGIQNFGTTTLIDSVVADNWGDFGAIHNFGTLNVSNSIITDNGFGHDAGGIVNELGGKVLLENSTVANNTGIGAGGILNRGAIVIRDSAIISNRGDCCNEGGGILNSRGSLEIVSSTIAKNTVGGLGGGGVANFSGDVSITNSTIRENADFRSDSRGAGLLNYPGIGGTMRIQNTIVAGNIFTFPFEPFTIGPNCFGTITSLGNNFLGDLSGCDINLQPSDMTGDPGLGALVEAGEEDLPGAAHYPVLAGSVLIDRVDRDLCPKKDQLGNPRTGPACDIGAVEFSRRKRIHKN